MKARKIERPELDERLSYGSITEWKFSPSIIYSHECYVIRFSLTFENGTTVKKQVGGFKTKKEANKIKELMIVSLHEGKYAPFDFQAMDVFNYWLYHEMLDKGLVTYNTFSNYRGVLNNHLAKTLKKYKMKELTRPLLITMLKNIKSEGILHNAYIVISRAFRYAFDHNLIETNPAPSAIREVRNYVLKKKKRG